MENLNSQPGTDPPVVAQYGYAFVLAWDFESLGGVNGVVRSLLQEFQRGRSCSPVAIEMSNAEVGIVPPGSTRPWPLVRTGQMSTWKPQSPWRSILAFFVKAPIVLWRLTSLCRKYSIRVFNPHFIGLEYFPLLALRKLGLFRGKLILSFHGLDILEMSRSHGVERYLSRALLLGADALVSCSEGLRAEILRFVPECAARTFAIPNGINPDAFLELASESCQLPARFQGKIILNVGAYQHKKGHDVLLNAFAELRARTGNVALIIAGQGSSAETSKLAAALGIEADVLLLENLSHATVASLMKRCDLFVLPSRWEPFGLVLLEAAVAGKPVVVTDTAGAREIITDGSTGLIVPIEDPHALAVAISSLLTDEERAGEIAAALRERAQTHFTWTQTYRRYLNLIDDLPPRALP